MKYQDLANQKINATNLSKDYQSRISLPVKKLLKDQFVIDVHTHFFDIKCINKRYFILRNLKDTVGVKAGGEIYIEFREDQIYDGVHIYEDKWEEEMEKILSTKEVIFRKPDEPQKGVIDKIKAVKFLGLNTMESVYNHYINNFSLAKSFSDIPDKNTLTTALMMDLEMGWGTPKLKPMLEKITQLKELASKYPVLPFLACDPRRADISNSNNNLYELFNKAFCTERPFFGVKIYPALGYDPSDYRLWPVYELCEKFNIPVLSHCGGETVSTDQTVIQIYEGDKKKKLHRNTRQDIAYALNDPNRWALVLERYPNLKLNLAHFGGYETWTTSAPVASYKDDQKRKETIFNFMEKYPNIYADFSYNFIEEDLSDNLINILYYKKHIRERTLFGSDYWVVNKETHLHKAQNRFIDQLHRRNTREFDLVKLLTVDNPWRYLFG